MASNQTARNEFSMTVDWRGSGDPDLTGPTGRERGLKGEGRIRPGGLPEQP